MEENAAEALMVRYLPKLVQSISGSPVLLACELLARRVISRQLYNETIDLKSSSSAFDKSVSLCNAVLRSLHQTPAHLVEFAEAARLDSPAAAPLYEEISKDPAYGNSLKGRKRVNSVLIMQGSK